jgi:hypothetical protein
MAGVYRPRHPETKPEAERAGKHMLRPVEEDMKRIP